MLQMKIPCIFFYDCPSTETVRDNFFTWAYREGERYVISRKDLFQVQVVGESNEVTSGTEIRTVVAKLFLKYIWDCRCRYSLPTFNGVKENVQSEINTIEGISTLMREHLNDSGLANIFFTGVKNKKKMMSSWPIKIVHSGLTDGQCELPVMGDGKEKDIGTENKTYMVSQLDNVSLPIMGDGQKEKYVGTENKTLKVSQLVNVSFARKGI